MSLADTPAGRRCHNVCGLRTPNGKPGGKVFCQCRLYWMSPVMQRAPLRVAAKRIVSRECTGGTPVPQCMWLAKRVAVGRLLLWGRSLV